MNMIFDTADDREQVIQLVVTSFSQAGYGLETSHFPVNPAVKVGTQHSSVWGKKENGKR